LAIQIKDLLERALRVHFGAEAEERCQGDEGRSQQIG
jgi:hypothetical protein